VPQNVTVPITAATPQCAMQTRIGDTSTASVNFRPHDARLREVRLPPQILRSARSKVASPTRQRDRR
jgi:hypothetical protein